MRVAEESVDPVVLGQVLIAQELRATVKGDGPTRRRQQGRESVADRADDAARAPVAVWAKAREAAVPLDERRDIGLAVGPPEDQQVGLPVPDLLPPADLRGLLGDRPRKRDLEAAGLAAEAAAPQPPGAEQMAVELERATFRAVDELIDRLMAHACMLAGMLQPAGDLLRRPPKRQHLGDVLA